MILDWKKIDFGKRRIGIWEQRAIADYEHLGFLLRSMTIVTQGVIPSEGHVCYLGVWMVLSYMDRATDLDRFNDRRTLTRAAFSAGQPLAAHYGSKAYPVISKYNPSWVIDRMKEKAEDFLFNPVNLGLLCGKSSERQV